MSYLNPAINFIECLKNFTLPSSRAANNPFLVQIGITNKCNLRCIGCFQSEPRFREAREIGLMPRDIFEAIIGHSKGFVGRLNFTLFGEPLLHPDILQMLSLAKGEGFFVEFSTNAILLTEDIVKDIVNLKINRIHISLNDLFNHLGEPERDGYLKKFLSNVRMIERQKRQAGARLPEVVVVRVKTHTSFDEQVNDFIRGNFMGLKIRTLDFCNWTLFLEGHNHSENSICFMPWLMMAIDWDGKITLCCDDCFMTNDVGNIKEISLGDAWNSERALRLREAILSRDEARLKIYSCKDCVQAKGHNFLKKVLRVSQNEFANMLKLR